MSIFWIHLTILFDLFDEVDEIIRMLQNEDLLLTFFVEGHV
jgi:hypothetical protein